MNEKLKTEQMEKLFRAVLCTVSELKAMEQRFEVALMLSKKHVYGDVVRVTGASTATISRVNRALNYGSDGYRTVIARLEEDGTV